MAAGALGLSIEQRVADSGDQDEAPPTLTVWRGFGGAFGPEAATVGPGEFESRNAICPDGYVVVGGGEAVAGPGLVTRSEAGARDIWESEVYNATDPLSTGFEEVRIANTAVCIKGEGIVIRTREGE